MKITSNIIIFLLASLSFSQNVYDHSVVLMGTQFEITVVAENSKEGNTYIDFAINEIKRIEKLISSWDPNSQSSLINKNAGIKPVMVDSELFQLIKRAIKISELTDGAFDISYASMDKIWKFDGSMSTMPNTDLIKESVEKVGYKNIILDDHKNSVFLKLKGMKIGFGAIGKGYAADKAKDLLQKKGVKAGIINASGDLNAWGKQPDGSSWMVAIINPLNKEKIFSWLPIHNSAVVTSGNYEKYVMFNDERYSHIIDPRTGYPSKGILSVTIFTSNSELADALATSVFIMGVDVGLDFINQLKGVECIIIDKDNKILTTKNINLNQSN